MRLYSAGESWIHISAVWAELEPRTREDKIAWIKISRLDNCVPTGNTKNDNTRKVILRYPHKRQVNVFKIPGLLGINSEQVN